MSGQAQPSVAEQPFRAFFEALPGLYLVLKADLTIVAASDLYLQATGTTREGIVGRGVFEVFPDDPDDPKSDAVATTRASFERVLARGLPDTVTVRKRDVRRPHGDGSDEKLWSATSRPVFGSDGQVTHIIHRLDAVAAPLSPNESQNDALFRGFLEAAPDAMVVVDAAGRIVFTNTQTESLFGYSRGELIGETVECLIPMRQRGAHERSRKGYLESRKVRAMGAGLELLARRKDGSEFPVEISLSPVETSGGVLASAAIRDVTDRIRIETALRRAHDELEHRVAERTAQLTRSLDELRVSEARFSRLVQSGIIGIVVGDASGQIIEANDAFLGIVACSREDLLEGKIRWSDLTTPESGNELVVQDLSATGVAHPHEKEYVRKDGSRVAVLVGIATLPNTHTIAFMVDLSAQKRAEEALKRTEGQLRHAQKMEAVGRLAGGVAHDFNNLLSVVLSYSEMIIDDLPPENPMRADVQEIEKAGKQAAEITRQLLTFSRQEVTEPRTLDLNHVLSNMDKMLQRILGEDVDLVSLRSPTLGRVRVDPSHIEQVIMNLAVNSRDAMPTGGKLTMETENVILDEGYADEHLGMKPGRYVRLAVSDTGMGMDRATQARIFEPFFTTKEKGKGTGLGLSTVFGIVQQCGGFVGVYSEPGHGTSFKVYIPLIDADADVLPVLPPPITLAGSETILLVEDDDQIRLVAGEILRKQGYQVIEARDAVEALRCCEVHATTLDLLVTDVVMPQMSGPELAKRVLLMRPGIKVLCMSGYTDDALVRHGALEARFAYLQKPITPQTLARKVRTTLDAP